jgi:hypothetical protein
MEIFFKYFKSLNNLALSSVSMLKLALEMDLELQLIIRRGELRQIRINVKQLGIE